MENKTIKELAVELTVEITAICDGIKGRSVFVNQLLRACGIYCLLMQTIDSTI